MHQLSVFYSQKLYTKKIWLLKEIAELDFAVEQDEVCEN